MRANKFIILGGILCAWFAVSGLRAATIPSGTMLTVSTVSLITSQTAVGRSFEAKLAQDVSVKGNVVLKARSKAFGKITSSRANPRKSEPLSVELTSVSANGRNVTVKTHSVEPGSSPRTARQAHYGHTGGTTVVNPGTTMQFQLAQSVTL